MTASDSLLNVGDLFDDFSSLKWAVELFERSQKSNYWIRDCRTIEAAQKKGIKRPIRESLIYYNLTWACVKGGRNYDESIRSPRGDCGSYVKVAVSKDGQALVIKDICTKHNHDTSQETFELLPKQKRLATDNDFKLMKVKKEKKDRVANNQVKRLIQRNLITKSGKVIKTRKFNASNSKMLPTRPRSLQDFVDGLRQSGEATVEVIEDEKGNMKGVFWQDRTMKAHFDSYPELLIVGSSNDLTRLKTSVVIQITVGGNGESSVASVFLISSDDVDVFMSLLNIFRNHNSAWLRTRTVLSSHDFRHRHIYRSCFPDASLHLCMSHTLEEMKKDICSDRIGYLSKLEKLGVMSLLESIVRANSQDVYDNVYDELQGTGLSKIMNYFNKNWHPLRDEWARGLKTSVHFNNETTQRLDVIFDKIKDTVRKSSPLAHFCQDLQKALQCNKKETDSHIADEISHKTKLMYEQGSVEYKFANFLTPFAFSETLLQLNSSGNVNMDAKICDVTSPTHVASAENVHVSATSCSCRYFTTIWLPCRHIFAFRRKAGLDLFFEDIARRWQLSTLKSVFPTQPKTLSQQSNISQSDKLLKGSPSNTRPETTNSNLHYRKSQIGWSGHMHPHMNGQTNDISQTQKFESLLVYAQRLAQLGSDVPMVKFVRRREILSRLVESWERGDDAHDDSLTSSFLQPSSHHHQEDLGLHNLAQPITNQIQQFQVHGSSSLPDNHHMSPFVAKERPYHITYQQQDHTSHGMGMMEHMPPWSHIVL